MYNIYRNSLFLIDPLLNPQICIYSSKFRLTQINLCLLSATACANSQILEIFGGRDWGWKGFKVRAQGSKLQGRKAGRLVGFKAGRLKNLVQISGV